MKVLKIGAIWCSGCLVMKPRWKEVEEQNPWLETEYIEYDDNPQAIEKYNLQDADLPVFIFLDKNDEELERVHGEISKKKIIEKINEYKDK